MAAGASRVAGGQDYEVRYEANKTGKSASPVKKAVKKVGSSRKRVERRIGLRNAMSIGELQLYRSFSPGVRYL